MSTDSVTDTQAVIDTAIRAAAPNELDNDGRLYTVVVPADGKVQVIDVEEHLEKFRETPRRKIGTYNVHDAESFNAYVAKHGDDSTEVWADVKAARITGVLNAHENGAAYPRWEDHRVVYAVQHTPAWLAWAKLDGHMGDQSTLAEHLEDRALDILSPSAADMLELAQTFQATIGVTFESSKRLSSGERQLEYREQVDAKAGKAGQLGIPDSFVIAMRPFEGADPFKLTARLRYRITGGTLRIGYKLERPEDMLREAFLTVVENVAEGISVPVFRGSRG